MYKVIVFDVGDTLIGYEPNQVAAIIDRFHSIGVDMTMDEATKINQTMELSIAEQIWREINDAPRIDDTEFATYINNQILSLPFVKEKISTLQMQEMFMATPIRVPQRKIVKPNTYSVLTQLRQKYRLGIISNYSASMLDYLQEAELTEYFETIIISEIVGYEKPDPKIYEYFLAKMKCEAKDCLYVGDHPFDVMGAKRAGMDVAWLNQIYEDLPEYISECPDYVIQNIGELTLIL